MGNVTSQVAGDYVSKKVGGEFGSMLGGAVGSTLGNTVSGAFSSSDTSAQPKTSDTNTFGGLNNGMNAQKVSAPKSSPKIKLNPKAGQTHVGAAQQTRNLKAMNQQRDLAVKSVQAPKKAPLTLNQKIEATTKKMNATRIAEQKAKMPTSQQEIYSDLVAKAKAGRQNNLAPQGTTQTAKLLGTASPTHSAQAPASATRTATPAYKISDEDDAAIGREADSIVKTKNLDGPLKYHKDAYATGTPKAKAEFKNFLGKVHDKDPGKAQDIIANMRKSGFDLGGSSTNEVMISGVPKGTTLSAGTDNGDGVKVVKNTKDVDLSITDKEQEMVKAGDAKGFWESRKAKGDRVADVALKSLDPEGGVMDSLFGGKSVNNRLEAFSRVYSGKSADIKEIRQDLMKAHMDATLEKAARNKGPLVTRDIYNYHVEVFKKHGLPSTAFGGAPFTGTAEEAELLDMFW